jgi:ABC-type nitrate/sulfonate/bicarbonate transport system ATPase subunit
MSSGFRLHSQSEATIAAVVGDVLSLVGLAGAQCPPPHQLSGGKAEWCP